MDKQDDIPYGFCHCGCGEKTTIAPMTSAALGVRKGEPRRFIVGHSRRVQELPSLETRLWEKVEKRAPNECWPFTGATARGYGRIGVGYDTENAHRVVLKLTAGPPPAPDSQGRHLCGNPICCNPAHLAWGDQSANQMDRVIHGTSNRGTRHGMAKLTENEIREIRRRCRRGETQRSVGADYGINQQSVSEIVNRKTWGWLDAEGGDA